MPEGHPHCQNAWTNTTIIRYLIADNRAFGRIHDKPDIGFDTTDYCLDLLGSLFLYRFLKLFQKRQELQPLADGCRIRKPDL